MKRVLIILLSISLVSCGDYKLFKELNNDNRVAEESGEKYLLIGFQELMDKLPSDYPVYYVGSKDSCHFFLYLYKSSMVANRYKVNDEEYTPKMFMPFSENNTWMDGNSVYPKDYKQKK